MKFSKYISYFFHPINFSIIGPLLYFLFVPKYIFKPQEYTILVTIFIGTYLFPLFLTYLLKRHGMINSYHMNTVEERKFPTLLFISLSFFIGHWLYKSNVVDLLSLLYFGFGVCLVITYILLQFKRKISLHTAAIGGLIGFLIYFSYYYKINLIILFTVLFLLSGIIATARLKLKTHNISEVVTGYILGISCQFIVYFIYSI
jgi:membrane-associated phospholipid phosphatase